MKANSIFSKEFRDNLLSSLMEAGVEQEKAEAIVDTRYKSAVKEATIEHLEYIINLLKENKFEKIASSVTFSPAGDCMGRDNYFIDFTGACNLEDIGDVITVLSGESKWCEK